MYHWVTETQGLVRILPTIFVCDAHTVVNIVGRKTASLSSGKPNHSPLPTPPPACPLLSPPSCDRLPSGSGCCSDWPVGGACVIHWLRGSSWLESLYLAFITLSTLGSRDVAVGPHADALMAFMIVYIILRLSTFAYLAADVGRFIFNAEFLKLIERHRMDRSIATLKDHFIVCGLGRRGTSICQYLHDRKQPFVVIDRDEAQLQSVRGAGLAV